MLNHSRSLRSLVRYTHLPQGCSYSSGHVRPAGINVLLGGSSSTDESLQNRLPLSKIVATIGPASEQLPMLSQVVSAGMRIMRINFSHATYEEADLRITNLNKCFGINHRAVQSATSPGSDPAQAVAAVAAKNIINLRAVMLDTQGPEIRTGSFPEGIKEIEFVKGDQVVLSTDEQCRHSQSRELLWVSYLKLPQTVRAGDVVLLDDGAVGLTVKETNHAGDARQVLCEVQNNGAVGNKKGVNLPGLKVDLPAMCEKDKVDIRWGIKNSVDYIAASFIRKAEDVHEIRAYATQLLHEMNSSSSSGISSGSNNSGSVAATGIVSGPQKQMVPLIISKIESVEALQNFDSILHASDGIMVARGDLAVEIPMETLANVQKEIVARCNAAGKPVIVATQMLETMQKNPRPTRAECTDVANAIRDGADCVMLSGESAKGKYPVETVSLMKRIVDQTELSLQLSEPQLPRAPPDARSDAVAAMAFSAVQAAHCLRGDPLFSCIVVMMSTNAAKSTALAKQIASFRPHVPVVCVVPNHRIGRQLQLYRSLHPVLMVHDTDRQETTQVLLHLRKLGMVKGKHRVLMVRQRSANHEIGINLCTA